MAYSWDTTPGRFPDSRVDFDESIPVEIERVEVSDAGFAEGVVLVSGTAGDEPFHLQVPLGVLGDLVLSALQPTG